MIDKFTEIWTIRPTRFFKVGDKVSIGRLENVRIKSVSDDRRFYTILFDHIYREDSMRQKFKSTFDNEREFCWYSIFPIHSSNIDFAKSIQPLHYTNRHVEGILLSILNHGMNFDAPYQRPLVWTQMQKENLIESIFNGIDIGRFLIRKLPYIYQFIYQPVKWWMENKEYRLYYNSH